MRAGSGATLDRADTTPGDAPIPARVPTTERLRFIDVAKGMSIVLVAFGHSQLVPMNAVAAEVNRSLGLLRMPLFFFMSGVFFRPATPFGTMLPRKTAALLKPYLVTLAFVVLARALVGTPPAMQVPRMLYGVGTAIDMPWAPLWYLAHLWLVFIYAWGLARVATRLRIPVWASVALLAASTIIGLSCLRFFQNLPIVLGDMHAPLSGLPFSADVLPVSTTYFLLGFALREHVVRFRPNLTSVVGLLLLFAAVNGFWHPRLDLNQRVAVVPLATAACSLMGIYLALSAAYVLNATQKLGAAVAFFGFNSLFVLLFHSFIEAQCRQLVSILTSSTPGLGIAATAWVTGVVVAGSLGLVIRRSAFLSALYLPRKPPSRSIDN